MSGHKMVFVVALSLFSGACLAHTGSHSLEGFGAGLTHPWLGADHVCAMLGVGLWSALLPGASWRLPAVFLACMLLGAGLGVEGFTLPGIETGIALSVLVLGLLVVAKTRFAFSVAAFMTGFFALFHGAAHGAEMASGQAFAVYALGFFTGTGLLQLAGLWLGRLAMRVPGCLRVLGGLLTSLGIVLMLQSA